MVYYPVPVTERQPEKDGRYFVFFKEGASVDMGSDEYTGDWFTNKMNGLTHWAMETEIKYDVTHWLEPRPAPQPLTVTFDGPAPTGENEVEYVGFFDALPGMVCSGATKQQAFDELMLSLAVKILYDSGVNDVSPRPAPQPPQDWKAVYKILQKTDTCFADQCDPHCQYQRNGCALWEQYAKEIVQHAQATATQQPPIQLAQERDALKRENEKIQALLNHADKVNAFLSNENERLREGVRQSLLQFKFFVPPFVHADSPKQMAMYTALHILKQLLNPPG